MRNCDTPSMDNIYNSTYYKETQKYEQNLSDEFYKKAQMPFKTGVIPHYFDGDDVNLNTNVIKSLTGNDINVKDFKHGNMQPFLRKGITQNTDIKENFGLDKNMGYTSEYLCGKREVPKSEFFNDYKRFDKNSIQPDKNKFITSRTEVGKLQNNVNPIEAIRVGPGINKGYSSEPTGGFHQADTFKYIIPKDRNELRPQSDQRNSIYTLPMKPKNNTPQRSMDINVSKNRAETSFNYTEDNWFKGQSHLKKEAERPQENIKETNYKEDIHINYYGTIKHQNEFISKDDDYGKENIIVYDNERNLSQKETRVANLSSVFKSLIAPITDVLKITMKEYLVDNPRLNGNAKPQNPEKMTVYDPDNHIMKTTVKETTIHEGNGGNVSGPDETYSSLYDTSKATTKETTIHEGNGGNLSGPDETYSGLYNTTKTTTKETTIHEGNGGNVSGYDETYSSLYDTTKTTTKETTIHEGNGGNLSGYDETYSSLYDTTKTTTKETTIHEGNGGNLSGPDETYSSLYDTTKTTMKETLIHEENGRGNIQLLNKGKLHNIHLKKTVKETLPVKYEVRNINNINYHSTYVYDPLMVAKTTVRQTTVDLGGSKYGFIGGILNSIFGGYTIANADAKNTQRQFSLTDNYGIAKSTNSFAQRNRDAEYNSRLNEVKEDINNNSSYIPGAGGKYTGLSKEDVNLNLNKKKPDMEDAERIGTLGLVVEGLPLALRPENITKKALNKLVENNDRIDNSILKSINENEFKIKINPI